MIQAKGNTNREGTTMTEITTNATFEETVADYKQFAKRVLKNCRLSEIVSEDDFTTKVALATFMVTGPSKKVVTEFGSAIFGQSGWRIIEGMLHDIDDEIYG